MYIDCASCWIYSRECCPVLNLNLTPSAGFGAGTPQQEHFKNAEALQKCSPGRAQHFQELKICGHGTGLALYRCAQNRFRVIVSELLRRKKISRGCAAHGWESPFAPNEVPAPVCAAALSGSLTEGVRSWHGITFGRLMQDSRYNMKKAERSADTTFCFFQTQE